MAATAVLTHDILLNPAVIFEILSPSTEKYDRGVKFQHNRTILVEHYTRGDGNTWTLRDHRTLEDELKIESIGATLPLRRIYDRIEFPAA